MEKEPKGNHARWYYTIVQNPGTCTEQMVGFTDPKTEKRFLPAFKSKDAARACFAKMPKDLFGQDYDAQAMIEEDLIDYATKAGHRIYLLDENGTILDYLNT